MRGWLNAAAAAADAVTNHPAQWLPGALAWTITVGWLPFLVAVTATPSVADLTFLGARVYTSGVWPWNAILAGFGVLLVAACALVLVAVAEMTLASGGRRELTIGRVGRAAAIGAIAALPALVTLLAGGTASIFIALDEFNAPGDVDPLLRTIGRLVPFVLVAVVAWLGGALVHAAAIRAVAWHDAGVLDAMAGAPHRLLRGGASVAVGAAALLAARVAYLVVASLLLGVLWNGLEPRISAGGMHAGVMPLLVGFVAIWLCCVLGGGALHAWGSLTWTLVLGNRAAEREGAGRPAPGDPHRP